MDDTPSRTEPSVLSSIGAQMSVRDRATDLLREAMIVGELVPGQIYSAPALAQRLGVSPTPVREAMMELTREGLVETIRHRGYRVIELDEATLNQITDLRELIEVPSVGRLAGQLDPAELAALRAIADDLDETAAAGHAREFIAADMRFHRRLLENLGNDVLVNEVVRLRGMTRLLGLSGLSATGELLKTAHEHHELLDFIEAGDRSGAEELMRQHLGHVRGVWAGQPETT